MDSIYPKSVNNILHYGPTLFKHFDLVSQPLLPDFIIEFRTPIETRASKIQDERPFNDRHFERESLIISIEHFRDVEIADPCYFVESETFVNFFLARISRSFLVEFYRDLVLITPRNAANTVP
jgi:hypothetical protein